MVFKLAFGNIKKSFSDYAIYFVTMMMGISIFYSFNAIHDQTLVNRIFERRLDILDLMKSMLSVASVIVSVVLAFLIVYASNFLMKRRKREFGIYMLLGMGKKNIAGILMVETVMIGVISLVVGMGLGIVLSQGMSMLVAKMFEADMAQFKFEVSAQAIGKTVLYFVIMYVLVLLLDIIVVGKSRLIRLLNAGKRQEKNYAKNPWLCGIVFVIAVGVLVHAYYRMTADAEGIDSELAFLIQILKGVVTTFLIFWSVSGFLIFVAKLRKKTYYRGINSFTTKELSNNINTNVFAGSIICLLLFITICIFSSSFSINRSLNDNLRTLAPMDVNFASYCHEGASGKAECTTVSEVFRKKKIDTAMFDHVAEVMVYCYNDPGQSEEERNLEHTLLVSEFTPVMSVSDFNRVAAVTGQETISLENNEFAVVGNYDYSTQEYNEAIHEGKKITLGGRELHSKYETCYNGFVENSAQPATFGFFIVPDDVVADEKLVAQQSLYLADYNEAHSLGREGIEHLLTGKKFRKKLGDTVCKTREEVVNNSKGLAVLIVFLGLYLSIIFILASSALLALKELSQAADNRGKYMILRKIGVDEKMLCRSLFKQNLIFFAMPLVLALIHSVFGIQVCLYIVGAFGLSGLVPAIVFTAIVLVGIYAIYFGITYRCSRRIIFEKSA